jgi:hypothetical protein
MNTSAVVTPASTVAPGANDDVTDVTDLRPILSWYTGRALERVQGVLPAIAESERAGGWLPRVARRARAALADAPVAKKLARANDRPVEDWRYGGIGLLIDIADQRGDRWHEARDRGFALVTAMRYGRFEQAPQLARLAERLRPHVLSLDESVALGKAARWAADFTPAARLFARLDAGRPRPSYAFGEVSEAVRANVEVVMGLSFQTVRVPDIRWELRSRIGSAGRLVQAWVGVVLWPAGCRHEASKFNVSARGNDQCQACGHVIRDSFNWTPLLLDGPAGPASLWVGRDCARHLFGCRVTGDGAFDRGDTASEGTR